MHSTNYTNAFIEVADDCKTSIGTTPPEKEEKTIAMMQYDMIKAYPYKYTSDEVIFNVYAERNKIKKSDFENKKMEFFAKGQACLRSSPLAKTYGWGIHFNSESKIALFAMDSKEYEKLRNDKNLKHMKAMKSSR